MTVGIAVVVLVVEAEEVEGHTEEEIVDDIEVVVEVENCHRFRIIHGPVLQMLVAPVGLPVEGQA